MTIDNQVFEEVASPCQRVEQQTAYYCGAACCKMIFDNLKIPVSQAEAYQLIHNDQRFKVEELYSDPLGIAACLNLKTPNDITFEVQEFVSNDHKAIFDEIYYTLKFLRIPCIALVQKGNHWVVISAMRISEESGGKREIHGFYVQNPWYGSSNNKYISAVEFEEGWLTPVRWGKTWKNSMVIISDGNVPVSQNISIARSFNIGVQIHAPMFFTKQQLAQSALREHGFDDFFEIKGGGAAVLAPIEILSIGGQSSYSIIPMDAMQNSNFNDFVYVAVDTLTGNLLEIEKFGNALQVYSDDEARAVIQNIHPAANIVIDPYYYWERSYVTMTRFQVFRKVSIDGTSMFLTSQGELKSDLTFVPMAGG